VTAETLVRARLRFGREFYRAAGAVRIWGSSKARPSIRRASQHMFTVAGLACFDAAAFVHSVFAGLIVTGVSFLVLEWKVSD